MATFKETIGKAYRNVESQVRQQASRELGVFGRASGNQGVGLRGRLSEGFKMAGANLLGLPYNPRRGGTGESPDQVFRAMKLGSTSTSGLVGATFQEIKPIRKMKSYSDPFLKQTRVTLIGTEFDRSLRKLGNTELRKPQNKVLKAVTEGLGAEFRTIDRELKRTKQSIVGLNQHIVSENNRMFNDFRTSLNMSLKRRFEALDRQQRIKDTRLNAALENLQIGALGAGAGAGADRLGRGTGGTGDGSGILRDAGLVGGGVVGGALAAWLAKNGWKILSNTFKFGKFASLPALITAVMSNETGLKRLKNEFENARNEKEKEQALRDLEREANLVTRSNRNQIDEIYDRNIENAKEKGSPIQIATVLASKLKAKTYTNTSTEKRNAALQEFLSEFNTLGLSEQQRNQIITPNKLGKWAYDELTLGEKRNEMRRRREQRRSRRQQPSTSAQTPMMLGGPKTNLGPMTPQELAQINKTFAGTIVAEPTLRSRTGSNRSQPSFETEYNLQRTNEQKAEFLKYGKLPTGFEFLPGHMGRLGSAGAVSARGAMPLGGGYSGGYSGGATSAPAPRTGGTSGGATSAPAPRTGGTSGGTITAAPAPRTGGTSGGGISDSISQNRYRQRQASAPVRKGNLEPWLDELNRGVIADINAKYENDQYFYEMDTFSGGQAMPGAPGRVPGSSIRHDKGKASDNHIYRVDKRTGKREKINVHRDSRIFYDAGVAAVKRGAEGIGFGSGYMSGTGIHIGGHVRYAPQIRAGWGKKGDRNSGRLARAALAAGLKQREEFQKAQRSSASNRGTISTSSTETIFEAGNILPGASKRRVNVPVKLGPASIRYNNPGASYPRKRDELFGLTGYGVIGGGHKIGQYPTRIHGLASNMDLFSRSKHYLGKTLAQATRTWRGGNPGSNMIPKFTMSDGTVIGPNTRITPELVKNREFMTKVFKQYAKHESGKKGTISDSDIETAWKIYNSGGIQGYKEKYENQVQQSTGTGQTSNIPTGSISGDPRLYAYNTLKEMGELRSKQPLISGQQPRQPAVSMPPLPGQKPSISGQQPRQPAVSMPPLPTQRMANEGIPPLPGKFVRSSGGSSSGFQAFGGLDVHMKPFTKEQRETHLKGGSERKVASEIMDFLKGQKHNGAHIARIAMEAYGLEEHGPERKMLQEFFSKGGIKHDPKGDKNAWCATFVKAVVAQAGVKLPKDLNLSVATNWSKVGQEIKNPVNIKAGDIAIRHRGLEIGQGGGITKPGSDEKIYGHVGIFTGRTRKGADGKIEYEIISGNATDNVESEYISVDFSQRNTLGSKAVTGIRRVNVSDMNIPGLNKRAERANKHLQDLVKKYANTEKGGPKGEIDGEKLAGKKINDVEYQIQQQAGPQGTAGPGGPVEIESQAVKPTENKFPFADSRLRDEFYGAGKFSPGFMGNVDLTRGLRTLPPLPTKKPMQTGAVASSVDPENPYYIAEQFLLGRGYSPEQARINAKEMMNEVYGVPMRLDPSPVAKNGTVLFPETTIPATSVGATSLQPIPATPVMPVGATPLQAVPATSAQAVPETIKTQRGMKQNRPSGIPDGPYAPNPRTLSRARQVPVPAVPVPPAQQPESEQPIPNITPSSDIMGDLNADIARQNEQERINAEREALDPDRDLIRAEAAKAMGGETPTPPGEGGAAAPGADGGPSFGNHPESSGAAPGTDGRGSYGRCFV